MATFEFRVFNYRCFGEETPLIFSLSPGFCAFVGPNDAGKSTALRFFSEFRSLWNRVASPGQLCDRVGDLHGIDSPFHTTDAFEIFNDRNNLPIRIEVELQDEGPPDRIDLVTVTINRDLHAVVTARGRGLHTAGRGSATASGENVVLSGVALDYSEFRSLFSSLLSVLYIPAFRNAINEGSGNYLDLVIGTAFVSGWDTWKNGTNKRQRDAMVDVEESIRQLLGYQSLAVNASPDKKHLRVVVDGKSRNLSEMGSGVAEFLLIIGNLFLVKPKTILIDEPETHLHPSKQIELLRLLLATSGADLVVFATHSLGLARSVTRNITLVRRDNSWRSTTSQFHREPTMQEFLGEMNYTAQREVGAATVFFVEGVTDVIAVRQFLRLYHRDQDFVLLPLLGDCLINGKRIQELHELSRLGIPCVALLDSERSKHAEPLSKNRQDFLQIWAGLGFRAHVLERRALENYFTDAAVKAVTPNATALGPYDKPSKSDKALNAAIAVHMSKADLDATDLGAFLATL